jgi:hypothetical protein
VSASPPPIPSALNKPKNTLSHALASSADSDWALQPRFVPQSTVAFVLLAWPHTTRVTVQKGQGHYRSAAHGGGREAAVLEVLGRQAHPLDPPLCFFLTFARSFPLNIRSIVFVTPSSSQFFLSFLSSLAVLVWVARPADACCMFTCMFFIFIFIK